MFLTFLVSFAVFYPSLFVFYTNDDFFNLKIANVNSIQGFLNFFNLFRGPEGWGLYRPLTTQVFYFITVKFFNLNPLPLHIISFFMFFLLIFLVYKLVLFLSGKEKISIIATFLYAMSATHFGHLYFLSTQELGLGIFVLLSCIFFLKDKTSLSLIFFIMALMSKETAVITPALLFLVYSFNKQSSGKTFDFKKLSTRLLPFIICLFVYLIIRSHWYGFTTGNSYIWDFSPLKAINTSFWYLLWSLNIPEELVNYIAPGLTVNPSIFVYWGTQIVPILILFSIQCVLIAWTLVNVLRERIKTEIKERDLVSVFCIGWFLISLLPVIFLPQHKFTFYLTLPLIGLVFRIAYLLSTSKVGNFFIGLFIILWTITSVLTLRFTVETNWITQGELVAKRVYDYVKKNENSLTGKTIVFYDSADDRSLPFSPTGIVENSLSNNNFFQAYYDGGIKALYGASEETKSTINISSRVFLGY